MALVSVHLHADDTQIYIMFNQDDDTVNYSYITNRGMCWRNKSVDGCQLQQADA